MIHPLQSAYMSEKNVLLNVTKYFLFLLWKSGHFRDLASDYGPCCLDSLLLTLPWRRCRIEANDSHVGHPSGHNVHKFYQEELHRSVWPWISEYLMVFFVFLWMITLMLMAMSWIPTAPHLCAVFLPCHFGWNSFHPLLYLADVHWDTIELRKPVNGLRNGGLILEHH